MYVIIPIFEVGQEWLLGYCDN